MMAGIVAPKLPARDDAKNARDDANARVLLHTQSRRLARTGRIDERPNER